MTSYPWRNKRNVLVPSVKGCLRAGLVDSFASTTVYWPSNNCFMVSTALPWTSRWRHGQCWKDDITSDDRCGSGRSRPVHQTDGNFNNHIGVPKTITDASGEERAWVLEMGMSALGEIHRLQEIGEPNIRIITNIGAAHVEGCGSIEGVAKAKGELFAGARPGDTCCINIDDHRVAVTPIPKGYTISLMDEVKMQIYNCSKSSRRLVDQSGHRNAHG